MRAMDQLVATVTATLERQRLLLATAESCTGGMVAVLMTDLPGSSVWFDRGWVTYSDAAKMAELGVEPGLLSQDGAVSEGCVLAMARGAIKRSLAHVSLAISGVAGPGGGSDEKPVGTVWIGWGQKLGYAEAECFHFEGDRQAVREQAARAALEGLLQRLGKGR